MATNTRGGDRGGKRGGSGRNNNPTGRNQYSDVGGTMRRNPLATAVAIGGAVATGVFLWTRRNQISDQIGDLNDQLSEWREGSETGENFATAERRSDGKFGGKRSQSEIAEEALTLREVGRTA